MKRPIYLLGKTREDMKEIHVKAIPLKEVILDMARVFGADCQRDCEVYTLHLPKAVGEGTVRGINFSTGLGLIFYDCNFNDDIKIHFDVEDIHPAKLLYCLEGEIVHYFGGSSVFHHLRPFEGAIVGSIRNNGHILSFLSGQRTKLSSVEIDRGMFAEAFDCELNTLSSPISSLLTDIDAREEFYHKGHLSLKQWEILNGLDEEEWAGVYQRLSLQSKATELMLWAIVEFDDDQLSESQKSLMRKSDVEIIRRAADLIAYHLSTPLNVAHLAEEVGTNINKLQNGFKAIYGVTVNEYVQRLRLEKTCYYLETTDMNIADIVALIGLSNHGYHSKMFKQTFGLSPLEYRKKKKGE